MDGTLPTMFIYSVQENLDYTATWNQVMLQTEVRNRPHAW
jgi:hypothetical protein